MRVVHCKKEPYDVYIGRPSPWGNLFKIGLDGNRDQVISKFQEWVQTSQDKKAAWTREHIYELRGKTLGCWCKPHPCHGDVLAKLAEGTS